MIDCQPQTLNRPMDSQHRHELAENELAHWLEDFIEQVKPFASLIVIGVVGVIALFTAWGFYQKSNKANQAAEWSLYTTTTLEGVPNMNALETAAADLEGSGAPADYASVTWAEGKLYEASETVLTDRDKALEATDAARQEFERLLLAKGVQPAIRNRAQFGLARSYELDGDWEKAVEAYKETKGAFAEMAAERAEALASEDAKEDLQWLATAKAPAFSMPRGPGIPGQQPDFAPDDFDMGAADAEPEADVTLEDLLESYQDEAGEEGEMTSEGAEVDAEIEEMPADVEAEADAPAESTEPAEPAAEEPADADTESADAGEQPAADEATEEEPAGEKPSDE